MNPSDCVGNDYSTPSEDYGIKVLKNLKKMNKLEFWNLKNGKKSITIVSYSWNAPGSGNVAGSSIKLIYNYDLLVAYYFYGSSATGNRYSSPHFKGEMESYQDKMNQCSWNLKRFKNTGYRGCTEAVNPSEY